MGSRDLRLCSPGMVALLRRQVLRLAAQGASRNTIAQRLRLRRATITEWLKHVRLHGSKSLLGLNRGRPVTHQTSSEKLLQLLLNPPPDQLLWTTRSAADAISVQLQQSWSPREMRRMLITAGLLPHHDEIWTAAVHVQTHLANHPERQPFLTTASPLGNGHKGWVFNMLDTTGRNAFLFARGPLHLSRWLAFLERVRKRIGERAALLLMQPGWLCDRPSVRRWLGAQQGLLIAQGVAPCGR